ncbi:hypothetical protein B0J14DRAFT_500964 [Halenospora varia]|nr:hypothetical protein B0J14DRAFT_500964 [Halenospora varia]
MTSNSSRKANFCTSPPYRYPLKAFHQACLYHRSYRVLHRISSMFMHIGSSFLPTRMSKRLICSYYGVIRPNLLGTICPATFFDMDFLEMPPTP